jgi:hypothetical protein
VWGTGAAAAAASLPVLDAHAPWPLLLQLRGGRRCLPAMAVRQEGVGRRRPGVCAAWTAVGAGCLGEAGAVVVAGAEGAGGVLAVGLDNVGGLLYTR